MAFWWNGLSNIIHAYFGVFAVYVSPVTMGLTALNRYTRICKSDQQYNLFFSKKKSLIFLGFSWTFVALCILIPRLTGLQEFYFVPSYAVCLNRQMSDLGKLLHYIVVLGLFFALPLAVTATEKFWKRFGNTILERLEIFEQTTTRQSQQKKFD